MKKQLFIFAIFSVQLGGCAVTNMPGTGNNAALNADYLECVQVASTAHPVKLHQHVTNSTYSYGGVNYALNPEVQEIDLNKDRRNRAREACMTSKGWSFTPIVGWAKQ